MAGVLGSSRKNELEGKHINWDLCSLMKCQQGMLTFGSAEGAIGNLLVKPLVPLITVQAAAESLLLVEYCSAWHGMYFFASRSFGA
jgi:hypothetical protein